MVRKKMYVIPFLLRKGTVLGKKGSLAQNQDNLNKCYNSDKWTES